MSAVRPCSSREEQPMKQNNSWIVVLNWRGSLAACNGLPFSFISFQQINQSNKLFCLNWMIVDEMKRAAPHSPNKSNQFNQSTFLLKRKVNWFHWWFVGAVGLAASRREAHQQKKNKFSFNYGIKGYMFAAPFTISSTNLSFHFNLFIQPTPPLVFSLIKKEEGANKP